MCYDGHGFGTPMVVKATLTAILVIFLVFSSGQKLFAQEGGLNSMESLNEARASLMQLPELKDLIKIAIQRSNPSRKYAVMKQQEKQRQKKWQLSNWDFLSVQGAAVAGRRDVFAINSDGTVVIPSASVADNMNVQASVSFKINPLKIFMNKKQIEIIKLERELLDVEEEKANSSITEGVVFAYKMTKKKLEQMDAISESLLLVQSRAKLAELEFRQGSMKLADYTEFHTKMTDLKVKFIDARGDFRLYYATLMERVYGKIP